MYKTPQANAKTQALDSQTVAMLNAQSLNTSAKAQADAAQKPVQVSAQIHGKSAQEIIAEVATTKASTPAGPAKETGQ